jgi:uncharacterized membrane protein
MARLDPGQGGGEDRWRLGGAAWERSLAEFVLSLAAFLAAHVVPTRPAIRGRLVAAMGERAYLAGYSVLSVLLLAWVVVAAVRAPYVPLWTPAPWTYLVPIAVMPLSLMLLGAGLASPNPLSVSLNRRETGATPGVGGMRHPVMWGFALWALSHIPPNGDVVSLILFGGLALFAVGGMKALDRRRRRELGEERWRALAGSVVRRPALTVPALGGAVAGIIAYLLLLLGGHAVLFGTDPLAIF